MPSARHTATDAELAILKLLWECESLSARGIRERLYPRGTPSDHAMVQKLLQRLEQKKLVVRDRRSFAHLFRATVTREELAGAQLEVLASKLADGSLVTFILHAVNAFSRKRVEVAKSEYEWMQALAQRKIVSSRELERARLEYERSLAQLRRSERAFEYNKLLVDLADTEYQQALEANKKAPNSVSELEIRKLRIKVDLAKVKLREVAD